MSSLEPTPTCTPLEKTTSSPRHRSACDRCRAQKLRCLRTVNPNGRDCDRCLRISAECVYGVSCRIGRPSTGSKSRRKHSKAQPLPSTEASSITANQMRLPGTDTIKELDMNDESDFNFFQGISNSEPFSPNDKQIFSSLTNGIDYSADLPAQRVSSVEEPEDLAKDLASVSLVIHDHLKTMQMGQIDTASDRHALLSRLQRYPLQSMFENTRKMVSIADSLSKELAIEGSVTSELPRDYSDEALLCDPGDISFPSIEIGSSDSSTDSPPTPDWLDTFSTSPERLTASTTISTPCSIAGITSLRRAPSRSTNIDTSVIFLLLSCHISILRLYTIFCSDLRQNFLSSSPADAGRLFPNLSFGSFQAFAGTDLESLIVAQVTLHMLDQLHKVHGVCCTSGLISPSLMDALLMHEEIEVKKDDGNKYMGIGALINDLRMILGQQGLF